jgi:hypothetical protein
MIRPERLTARMEGDFVVFLIGMRINKPLMVHKWLPVVLAMPKMITELYARPEHGFLHAEMWFSRTTLMVQYWRSIDDLLAYAKDRQAKHLPAWKAFNTSVGTDGTVGIWHESYLVRPEGHENIYVNMPPFGLGRVGHLCPAAGPMQSAQGRLAVAATPDGSSRSHS